jgi:hypothetical protein
MRVQLAARGRLCKLDIGIILLARTLAMPPVACISVSRRGNTYEEGWGDMP